MVWLEDTIKGDLENQRTVLRSRVTCRGELWVNSSLTLLKYPLRVLAENLNLCVGRYQVLLSKLQLEESSQTETRGNTANKLAS